MKRFFKVFVACQLLWISALAQDDFTEIHNEDFARWSGITSLSQSDIHKMWRSTSHYDDERDDESSIELIDIKSLSSRQRQQILMIISAGLPRCITVAVFSAAPGHQKFWQESQGPDNNGFCDNLGIPVDVSITKEGMMMIEVTTAVHPVENEGSRAVMRTYSYKWDGTSYVWLANRDSSRVIRSPKLGPNPQ